jgi:hypothetical protein
MSKNLIHLYLSLEKAIDRVRETLHARQENSMRDSHRGRAVDQTDQ